MGNSDGTLQGLPAGHRLHEFEIVRIVGVGGFSIVYLALDHQLHRHVALKEYIPGALAVRVADHQVTAVSERDRETFRLGLGSFVNEARLLAAFDHPSLLKVYRFWEQNGTAYMVMPYYAGPTLKAVLQAQTAPPDEAWLKRLLEPLLDALQTLHAGNCFHRDISPDNILMLGPQMTPLLLDFGAARRVIGNAAQALTAILKPGFAPIEQYAGTTSSTRQGAWTDVYAVCAVLYTAISGTIPIAAAARVMDDELEPISARARGCYSAAFLRAIDRGLAVRPEGRPQDVATLRAELFAEASVVAPPPQTVLPVLSEPVSLDDDASMMTVPMTAPAPPPPGPPQVPVPEPLPQPVQLPRAGARRVLPWAAVGAVVIGAGLLWWWRSGAPVSEPAGVAATSPAVAPAARRPFSVVGALEDIVRFADPTLAVVAVAERPSVRIGRDDIRLRVKANRAGYLYVLFSGTGEPEIRLLYPNQRDSDPRVPADTDLVLPSAASKLRMTASGPPGVDHIVAIVSPTPRSFDDVGLRSASNAAFDLPQFDLVRAAALWGSAGASRSPYAGRAECPASQACDAGYGAALLEITETE